MGEFTVGREGFCERFGLGLARFCAKREDDGNFVENDSRIFDEHRIGESRLGGERVDVEA